MYDVLVITFLWTFQLGITSFVKPTAEAKAKFTLKRKETWKPINKGVSMPVSAAEPTLGDLQTTVCFLVFMFLTFLLTFLMTFQLKKKLKTALMNIHDIELPKSITVIDAIQLKTKFMDEPRKLRATHHYIVSIIFTFMLLLILLKMLLPFLLTLITERAFP
jgi:hypothetical protein